MASFPNVNSCNKYARDVVAGRVAACKLTRYACQRHLDDLAKSQKRGYRWTFSKAEAERACLFVQRLPHAKGKWAAKKQLIVLEPWQRFIIGSVFGWISKKTGRRRFREVYCEVPRKNGKSVLAAGIGLLMWCADGEYGAEVYCGATTEKQAMEVFRPAKQMLVKTPALVKKIGAEVMARNLSIPADESRFEPIIGDPGDGSSPSCAIVDEYHEHDTPALYETMLTGMGARDEPLIFAITTAGFNLAGPCYIHRSQVVDMLNASAGIGDLHNDELFGIIYTLDDKDDWRDPANLRKANPNYGVSVSDEYLHKRLSDAVRYPSRQNAFKTKHLNIWVSAAHAWLNMADWAACGDSSLKIEDFYGKTCWVGVDLASKSDITAVALVFRDKVESPEGSGKYKDRWTVFCRSYLPEGAVERASHNQKAYEGWVHDGALLTTDGDETDFDVVREDIHDLAQLFDIKEVVYDKWRATQLSHQLLKDGANAVEFGGGYHIMNMPMREVEAALITGRFRHDGNPVLTWMAGNIVTREHRGCLVPMKADEGKTNMRKIDGMVAILMAMSRALLADGEMPSLLESLTEDDFLMM
ncbi:terminase large subunit [Pseudomonas fulva]|uniref:terminase large subunit n=1 Tax=Pseudomonas fulva TaxID=47880 RepID=UPI0018A9DCEB|nr:terminase TerL endonuclease subunit [Pseudomonas fulva]MBF8694912.1 terminase large subunit [Pseudomonas fulva]